MTLHQLFALASKRTTVTDAGSDFFPWVLEPYIGLATVFNTRNGGDWRGCARAAINSLKKGAHHE